MYAVMGNEATPTSHRHDGLAKLKMIKKKNPKKGER